MSETKMVSVRLPVELFIAVELRAERERRTVSNVLVGLIRAGLSERQEAEGLGRPLPAVSGAVRVPAAADPAAAIAERHPRPGHDKATCKVYNCGMCKVT